jgi:hypothetical protein
MATAAKKTEAEAPRRIRLPVPNLKLLAQEANQYAVKLDQGHRFEDMLNPDYWANHARKIRKNTLLFCTAYDDSFYAILWVYDAGPTWLRVRKIVHESFEKDEKLSSDPSLYTIDKVQNGWRVIHKDSKALLASGLDSEEAAESFVKMTTKT